jgi:signal transduction histidine kinase
VNGRLIEAQESERARIARDLHDDIGQRLALLTLALEQVKGLQPDSSGEVLSSLDALQKQTAEITADVQALSHELHSPRLLHLGVVAAMRVSVRSSRGKKTSRLISATRTFRGVCRLTFRSVSSGSFRKPCTTEFGHSRARHFDVHLRGTGDAVHLTVRDEGVASTSMRRVEAWDSA